MQHTTSVRRVGVRDPRRKPTSPQSPLAIAQPCCTGSLTRALYHTAIVIINAVPAFARTRRQSAQLLVLQRLSMKSNAC